MTGQALYPTIVQNRQTAKRKYENFRYTTTAVTTVAAAA